MIVRSATLSNSLTVTVSAGHKVRGWVALLLLLGGTQAVAGQNFWNGTNIPTYCITCQALLGTSSLPPTQARLYLVNSNQAQMRIESNGTNPTDTAVDFKDPSHRWVIGINVFGIGAGKFSLFDGTNFTTPLTVDTGGSLLIATTTPDPDPSYKLVVAGSVRVDGNIAAKYQDLAEWVPAHRALARGTVVILDREGRNEVTVAAEPYDTKVAGVISERPGVALGEPGENKVLVAMSGRVKVKVDARHGAIRVGDLLVTSDREGFAMRSEPIEVAGAKIHRPGTLIGKALEPLEKGQGEILVLLSLQ